MDNEIDQIDKTISEALDLLGADDQCQFCDESVGFICERCAVEETIRSNVAKLVSLAAAQTNVENPFDDSFAGGIELLAVKARVRELEAEIDASWRRESIYSEALCELSTESGVRKIMHFCDWQPDFSDFANGVKFYAIDINGRAMDTCFYCQEGRERAPLVVTTVPTSWGVPAKCFAHQACIDKAVQEVLDEHTNGLESEDMGAIIEAQEPDQ